MIRDLVLAVAFAAAVALMIFGVVHIAEWGLLTIVANVLGAA